MWDIRNNITSVTDDMVEYDDKIKNLYNALFEDTSKYEEVLNESSIVSENYLRIILKITNMNLRHFT